jgi:hypothetical protein
MTHSPTSAERLAIRTGNAALLNSASPTSHIVEQVVFALGAAGLLMDPETAEELRRLRAVAGDGATRTVDEDPITLTLTPAAEELLTRDARRDESVEKLRGLLARQRDREDHFVSPLHRDYRTPHDMPRPAGACDVCGDGPDRWCPDCGACRRGCHGGAPECPHLNAPWAVTP